MFRIIIALVWLALAFPCQAQMTTLGAGGTTKAGLPGPPTFAFEANTGSSGSGVGPYTASLSTPDTGTNRRLYAFASFNVGSATSLTACTIGGVTCDVTLFLGQGGGTPQSILVSAPVPTGNPTTVSVTFNAAPGSGPFVYLYSVDTTKLSSITPVTSVLNQSAVTTITSSVAVLANGSILLLASGFGGSPSGYSISASTCGITASGTFGTSISGLANGCAANASSSATLTWTGSTAETLWLAAFR